jgi:hypothetical protein
VKDTKNPRIRKGDYNGIAATHHHLIGIRAKARPEDPFRCA